jgi:hypothetical protein
MARALVCTREDMDRAGCGNPTCTHDHTVLFLHAACHPRAGLDVAYDKRTGRLTVSCRTCDKVVDVIAVARSELVQ